jgi:hypothetical protein
MGYFLFLDDVRKYSQMVYPDEIGNLCLEVVHCKTYNEFVSTIDTRGLPTVVSFDHDLSLEHYLSVGISAEKDIPYETYKLKTGYHAAQYLIEYCKHNKIKLPICIVHSANPRGKKNIINLLRNHDEKNIN